MFTFKKVADPGTKKIEHYPYDPKTQRHYRKIVGGFVSPGPAEGAIVICGLQYSWRPPARIFVLQEFLSLQPEELILRAVDSRQNFKSDEFFSYNDENFLRYLTTRNAAVRERQGAELHLNQAPNAATDNISYHLHLLNNFLIPGSKRLVLGDGNLFASLQAVPHTEINTASARQHPLAAALGYSVAALEVYYGNYGFEDRPRRAKIDYDVLNYMND
jgi:hypothetical protein